MQRAVGFDKEKCSCNICLTLVCSFINAKWSINQSGMALRLFRGSVINLMPVLMKNEGERPCDSENVYITRKVIIACNSAAHLPACRGGWRGEPERQWLRGGDGASKSALFVPRARSVIASVILAPFMQISTTLRA